MLRLRLSPQQGLGYSRATIFGHKWSLAPESSYPGKSLRAQVESYPGEPLPAAQFFGKESQWCVLLTHQLYPSIDNPCGRAQSTNQLVVVRTTKNTERIKPIAVGKGQYVYSITNKVTPVDYCAGGTCFWAILSSLSDLSL